MVWPPPVADLRVDYISRPCRISCFCLLGRCSTLVVRHRKWMIMMCGIDVFVLYLRLCGKLIEEVVLDQKYFNVKNWKSYRCSCEIYARVKML